MAGVVDYEWLRIDPFYRKKRFNCTPLPQSESAGEVLQLSAWRGCTGGPMTISRILRSLALGSVLLPFLPARAAPHGDGQLAIEVVDAETGQPIAARMHLKNGRGRPVKLRAAGLNQYADHFYVDGKSTLALRIGQYTFDLEAGPEYRTQNGHFEIKRHADDSERIEMHRFADLAKEGWWAGDLDAERRADDLPLALRAESLAYVPNRDETGENVLAAELLVFGLSQPLDAAGKTSLEMLREAKRLGGHVVARTPFAWDLPVWLS